MNIVSLYKTAEIFKNKLHFIQSVFSDKSYSVLDVWFYWQWISPDNPNWLHDIIRKNVHNVLWIDISDKIFSLDKNIYKYELKSAESFDYNKQFDIIFAGDLIEHLSNPGLFFESCKKSINKDWTIIISTPNCFNFFNIIEKIFRLEPTVNKEHTCYYNIKTFNELISRYDLEVEKIWFIKNLWVIYKQSFFKKIQNIIYNFVALFTPKFLETIVFFVKTKDK